MLIACSIFLQLQQPAANGQGMMAPGGRPGVGGVPPPGGMLPGQPGQSEWDTFALCCLFGVPGSFIYVGPAEL